MAKKKKAEASKGSPAWMATFSDLMNLLLCFFVLLFSMSTVSEEKFEMVIASLQSKISIFEQGSTTIGEGSMVGGGIRQLEFLDNYPSIGWPGSFGCVVHRRYRYSHFPCCNKRQGSNLPWQQFRIHCSNHQGYRTLWFAWHFVRSGGCWCCLWNNECIGTS